MYILIVYRGQPSLAQGPGGARPVDQRGTVTRLINTLLYNHIFCLYITHLLTPYTPIYTIIVLDKKPHHSRRRQHPEHPRDQPGPEGDLPHCVGDTAEVAY